MAKNKQKVVEKRGKRWGVRQGSEGEWRRVAAAKANDCVCQEAKFRRVLGGSKTQSARNGRIIERCGVLSSWGHAKPRRVLTPNCYVRWLRGSCNQLF